MSLFATVDSKPASADDENMSSTCFFQLSENVRKPQGRRRQHSEQALGLYGLTDVCEENGGEKLDFGPFPALPAALGA